MINVSLTKMSGHCGFMYRNAGKLISMLALFPMIVAVKVVASSASIIVHYTRVHVASQNTLEISLGHEYKIVDWLYLY